MKLNSKKNILCIFLILKIFYTQSQTKKDLQMYVPVEIGSWDEKGGRLDWDTEDGQSLKDLYFNIMKPYFINPDLGRQNGKSPDLDMYINGNKKLLYNRKECDSVITFFINRLSRIKEENKNYYTYKIANETLFYYLHKPEKDSIRRSYTRCVCLPASEIMLMKHGNIRSTDRIWLEPSDFMKQFKQYQLDYLDVSEIPYLKRFPLDISPSFDCSQSKTLVEKTICRDVEVSRLDKELNEIYKQTLLRQGEKIRINQIIWNNQREKKIEGQSHTKAVQILKDMYIKRIMELRDLK